MKSLQEECQKMTLCLARRSREVTAFKDNTRSALVEWIKCFWSFWIFLHLWKTTRDVCNFMVSQLNKWELVIRGLGRLWLLSSAFVFIVIDYCSTIGRENYLKIHHHIISIPGWFFKTKVAKKCPQIHLVWSPLCILSSSHFFLNIGWGKVITPPFSFQSTGHQWGDQIYGHVTDQQQEHTPLILFWKISQISLWFFSNFKRFSASKEPKFCHTKLAVRYFVI